MKIKAAPTVPSELELGSNSSLFIRSPIYCDHSATSADVRLASAHKCSGSKKKANTWLFPNSVGASEFPNGSRDDIPIWIRSRMFGNTALAARRSLSSESTRNGIGLFFAFHCDSDGGQSKPD